MTLQIGLSCAARADGRRNFRCLLIAASDAAATALAPLGASLTDALVVTRAGPLALTRRIAGQSRWLALRAQLIAQNPGLQGPPPPQERGSVAADVQTLERHGSARDTAVLAAVCYAAGHARSVATGQDLPAAVDEAFRQIATPGITAPGAAIAAQH